MGVQVEAATAAAVPLTTLLSKASVASILELVQDVQAHGAALSKAADVLFGDTAAAADDTNQVSVGDSNLVVTVHALTAIQVAVTTALGLLTSDKQQVLDDMVKDDEHRVMEGPALLPGGAPSSSQQPELDEAKVVNSGVYVHESEAELEATDEPAAVQAETFPTEILVENINHLMFVVHGIGEHKDFVVESYDDDNGSTGESGNFRELFSTMRDSLFSKEIPLSLEIHPIEWHSEVHKSGVDDVFDKISPAASTTLRDVNKRLIMDVLYYSAPKYGQMIVDTVTKQMNDKYTAFMAANPGWQGFVSVFAHSLGTLVAYDILTHEAGEVGSNGVVFPGLAFPVENLFCAGSPVPIFALSRGQLDIQDSVCTGGLRRPKVNHYFNLFHPADPIAYRVEPLVDVGMSDYPAIKLQKADSFKNKTFGEMVLIYDKLTDISSVCNDWDGARIDFEVQRRFFEGPIDTLYAPLSHSVYWSSEAVVTITLLAICRPVVDIITRYMTHNVPLPTLRPRRLVPFTPYKTIKCATTALVRDGFTGAWEPNALFLGHKRVYFAPSAAAVACTKLWSVPLTAKSAVTVDPTDSSAFQFTPDTTNPSPSMFSSTKGTQTLYTTSPAQCQEWVDAINQALASESDEHTTTHPNVDGLVLPRGDSDINFFDATLTGTLRTRGMLCDAYNWYVLTDCSLDCYDACPLLKEWTHFSLKVVFATPDHGHIRLVSRHGTSVTFKIPDTNRFNLWLATIQQFPDCKLILEDC